MIRRTIGKVYKLAALMMAVLLLASSGSVILDSYAATQAEIEKKYSDLEKKRKETQQKINAATAEQKEEQAYKKLLDDQVDTVSAQIEMLDDNIADLNRQIVEKEAEIENKQKEIDDNYELLKKRLLSLYVLGRSSNLELLLDAKGYSDFMARSETIRSISRHDKALLESLKSDKLSIEATKAEIEGKKNQADADKAEQDAKRAELSKSVKQSNDYLDRLKNDLTAYSKQVEEYTKGMIAADKELQEFLRANSSSNIVYDGKGFAWPVPGYGYISSPFGNRTWGNGVVEFHTGIDIATNWGAGQTSINGKNIVASSGGKIIRVQYRTDGYGLNVTIDHGSGFSTLYAHMSSISVSEGQTVTQGQVIGRVGTTGNSTGYHLHFEVRVGGVAKNPQNYVTYKG